MKNLRLYASFAAGTVLSATVIAALLISATPVNTQASTQSIPIFDGSLDAEMEAAIASAEQATAAAIAAGVEIPDWILPLQYFASTITQGQSTRFSPVITDINGDGLPDFIYSLAGAGGDWNQTVYLNTGNGWEKVTSCYYENEIWSGDCEFRNP